MNRAWPFLVLLLATTGQVASARTAISILDSEIRCKCGFEVGLQNGKPMLIELIEDNGIVDFCDSKGQDECADYCRNQVSAPLESFECTGRLRSSPSSAEFQRNLISLLHS